jgi:hypothetical protein
MKDGTKNVPSGPPGYFSKTNWSDRVERRDGRDIVIKKVSSLLKVVDKLKDEQWIKIIEGAWVYVKQKSLDPLATVIGTASASSDFEMEDDDDDLKLQATPDDENDDDNLYA